MSLIDVVQSIPCYYDDETSPYGIACLLFAGRLVRDRFNNLNSFSQFNWIPEKESIPTPNSTPLAELLDRRANELLGQSISVQWSGGVDSTTLLLALIKNGISKEDLLVYYDNNSVQEYPKLFHWLQNQGYSLKFVNNWKSDLEAVQTDIITNGWCADQLFGSIFFHSEVDSYFLPLDQFLKTNKFPKGYLSTSQIEAAISAYNQAAENVLRQPLTIAAELGWFINFCMKWTWVRAFNELFLLGTQAQNKTQVFYNTDYFQAWSLNNFPKIKETNIYSLDTRNYKKELKEYCYSVFPDMDYLENKTKYPSWNSALRSQTIKNRIITLKTDKEFEVLNLPINTPENCNIDYIDQFFTKFKK